MPKNRELYLHVHTDHSLLDERSPGGPAVRRAAELNVTLSITDHGVLRLTSFGKQAQKHGIKPLLGCEIYLVCEDQLADSNEQRAKQKSRHMGLLARNFTGYQNLYKIVSKAHTQGFYRTRAPTWPPWRPTARTFDFSGCLAAVIPQYLLEGKFGSAAAAAKFIDVFGKDFFIVELMDHGIEEQRRIIPDLLRIATELTSRSPPTTSTTSTTRTGSRTTRCCVKPVQRCATKSACATTPSSST